MATVGEIAFKLRADVENFKRGIVQAEQALKKLEDGTGKVEQKASRAAPGLNKLQNVLANIGFAASGLPGPLGRVADKLSSFAFGGALTVGIAAGAAAIGFAWKKMREEAKQTEDQLKSYGERLDKIKGKLEGLSVAMLGFQRMDLQGQIRQAERLLTAEMSRPPTTVSIPGLPSFTFGGPDADRIRDLQQLIKGLELAIRDLDKVAGQKKWAASMAEAGEEAKNKVRELIVTMDDLYEKLGKVKPKDDLDSRLRAQLAEEVREAAERLGKEALEAAEQWIAGWDAMRRKTEEDAEKLVQSITKVQNALNMLLDVLYDLKAGNFGSVLGSIIGGVVGFVATGGNLGGAAAGAQIGGRAGGLLDQSVSSPAIPEGVGVPSISLSGMPPATNPLAQTRDGDWIRFLSESLRVAGARGSA